MIKLCKLGSLADKTNWRVQVVNVKDNVDFLVIERSQK